MPKVTPEELYENLEFKCQKCGVDCSKTDIFEPELGYISRVDGGFVGPLCQKCFDDSHGLPQAIKKIPDTAFLVVVKPDGEGVFFTENDVEIKYRRSPTQFDIKTACKQILDDLDNVTLMNLFGKVLSMQKQQSAQKLIIPR